MLQKIFENEYIQYMVVGLASIGTLMVLAIISPVLVIAMFLLTLLLLMSLACGYIIVDTYRGWKNDKDQSRKTTSSSKNDSSHERFY